MLTQINTTSIRKLERIKDIDIEENLQTTDKLREELPTYIFLHFKNIALCILLVLTALVFLYLLYFSISQHVSISFR